MSNVKTAISILWFLFTIVIGSYYFVLTNDVQNLEKELAQINRDIESDIRDIHILEADWSELNNPERLKVLAGKYISLGEGKISDSEDISYKMAVDDKRYEASFGFIDSSINGLVWYMIAEQYGSYRIAMFYENLDNAANGDDL